MTEERGISEKGRIYNLIFSNKENEEYKKLQFAQIPNLFSLPSSVDLITSKKFDFVYDQLNIGSCVANTTCWCYKFLRREFNPSRLFSYYYSRVLDQQQGDNSPIYDDGTTMLNGMRSIRIYGTPWESLWPYITRKYSLKPSNSAINDALKHKILQFSKLNQDLNLLKNTLANGLPFVIGIYVYSSFENSDVDITGIVPYPNKSTERFLGGHAITIVGYDDITQRFKFVNSWGRGWGNRGYGYIPYNYVLDRSLTDELYVLQSINFKKKNMNKNNKKLINKIRMRHMNNFQLKLFK